MFILFGSELLVFFNFDLFGFLSSFFVTLDPFWVVRDLSVTVEFQIKGYNLEKILRLSCFMVTFRAKGNVICN